MRSVSYVLQIDQASADIERRQAEVAQCEEAAAAVLEEVRARERAVKRQEDGLEGLKVGALAASISCTTQF